MIVGWPQVRSNPGLQANLISIWNVSDGAKLCWLPCMFRQASICNYKYVYNKSLRNGSCCAIMCREYQQKGKAWEHDQSTRLNNHRKTYHGKFCTKLLLYLKIDNKTGKPSELIYLASGIFSLRKKKTG